MMIRSAVLSAFFASSASAQQLTAGVPTWYCPPGKNAAECADLFMTHCLERGGSNSGCTSGLCRKPPGCYTGTENECYVRPNYGFPDDTPIPTGACAAGKYGDAAGTGVALDYPTSANFYGAVPTFTSAICPAKAMMCTLNGAGLIPIGSTMGSFSCEYNGASISVALNPNTATSFTATTPAGYSIAMMVGTTTAGTASYGYFITETDGVPAFGSSNKVTLSVMDIAGSDGSFNGVYVCIEPMANACNPDNSKPPSDVLPYLAGHPSPTNAPVNTSRPSKAPTSASPTKAPQAAAGNEGGIIPTPVVCADEIGGFVTPTQESWNNGVTGDAYNLVGAGQGGMKTAPDCPMTKSGYSLRCVTQDIDGSSTNYGVEFWVPGGNVLANPGESALFMCEVAGCNPQDTTGIVIPVQVTNVNGVAFEFNVQDTDYVITMLNMKAGVNANMVSFPICDDGADCTNSTVASSTIGSGRSSVTASPPYLNGKYQGLSHVNLCIAPVCAICDSDCASSMRFPTCDQSASSYFVATAATTTAATAKPKGKPKM